MCRVAVVRGIARDHRPYAMHTGFLDGHFHAAFADDHAHAVMSVDHCRGLAVADYFEIRDRLLDLALDDAVVVNRLQAPHAVRINAPFVGADHYFGAEPGFVRGLPLL